MFRCEAVPSPTTETKASRATTRRERAIQRRARLAATAERALAGSLGRILARLAGAVASRVEAGDEAGAFDEVDARRGRIEAEIRARGLVVAMATAEMVLADLGVIDRRGAGSAPEVKRATVKEPTIAAVEAAVFELLREEAALKAKGITETTLDMIRRSLEAGYRAGEGSRTIARRIRDDLGGPAARWRAETIARTETHSASERGAYEAALATGLDLDKEWGATEDARTRPTHSAADGQRVDAFALFAVGETLLRYPGDSDGAAKEVINCRCVALYLPRPV